MSRLAAPRLPAVDHYKEIDLALGGATVKNLLEDPATGYWYIAKLGTRNSDLEVMTEFIIYLIGRNLGAPVAEARIATYQGKLRFLSRYFLDVQKAEELVHGYQLFLELHDQGEMDKIKDDRRLEQAMFNVQTIKAAFGAHYGKEVEERLFESLVEMIVHDAIIGVQDRHGENWGVIVQRRRDAPAPRFAPIYDSARGLLCNELDDKLLERFSSPAAGQEWLDRYASRSRPLIGWEGGVPDPGQQYLRHHQVVAAMYHSMPAMRSRIRSMLSAYDYRWLGQAVQRHLGSLCTGHRLACIQTLLTRRIRLINRTISGAFMGAV